MTDRLVDRVPFTALGLLWPFGAPPQPPGPSGSGRSFRLVASNALKYNKRPEAWAEAVLALEPDVLCVAELTPALDRSLRAAGAPPHSCTHVEAEPPGTGLWSRWPLDDARMLHAGHAMPVAAIPELGVTVAAVHCMAPSRRWKVRVWWQSFDAVTALASSTAGPLVVAGDWNATMAHSPMRRLVATGLLRDAHTDAGRRSARTWPTRLPVALLDRALVSPDVAVRSIAEHKVPGSDHVAIAADLEVVDSPTATFPA